MSIDDPIISIMENNLKIGNVQKNKLKIILSIGLSNVESYFTHYSHKAPLWLRVERKDGEIILYYIPIYLRYYKEPINDKRKFGRLTIKFTHNFKIAYTMITPTEVSLNDGIIEFDENDYKNTAYAEILLNFITEMNSWEKEERWESQAFINLDNLQLA